MAREELDPPTHTHPPLLPKHHLSATCLWCRDRDLSVCWCLDPGELMAEGRTKRKTETVSGSDRRGRRQDRERGSHPSDAGPFRAGRGWTRARTAVHSWVEVSSLPPPMLWVLGAVSWVLCSPPPPLCGCCLLGPVPRKTDGGGDDERAGQTGWGCQLGLGKSTPACPPCWAPEPPAG